MQPFDHSESIEPSDRTVGPAAAGDRAEVPNREALSVAIASGKGGTGKSFLATNLAIVAARSGSRCTLVDADYGLAADHLLLGVSPRRTIQDLVEGRAAPAACLHETPFGVRLVPGTTGVTELAALGRRELHSIARGLGEWCRESELLLIDAGAGIQSAVISTIVAADAVVLVVQSEIASLTDAYAVLKCLMRRPAPHPRFGVVVNRATSAEAALASFAKLADVARRFLGVSLHDLGHVSEEPAVTPRRLGQAPLVASHPECRTAVEIRRILVRLGVMTGGLLGRPRLPTEGIAERMIRQLPRPA